MDHNRTQDRYQNKHSQRLTFDIRIMGKSGIPSRRKGRREGWINEMYERRNAEY